MHAIVSFPMAVDMFGFDPYQYGVYCGSSNINYISMGLLGKILMLAYIVLVASLQVLCHFSFNYAV